MKSFKEFLKQLKEDKLLTKEDEGGTPAGDVTTPSSDTTTGDIQPPPSGPGGSVTTGDILGNCDHEKNGFFSNGCFHRPLPVFPQIISRIPKKKKKKKS